MSRVGHIAYPFAYGFRNSARHAHGITRICMNLSSTGEGQVLLLEAEDAATTLSYEVNMLPQYI